MQTEILNITGMTCGGCSSTVTRALVAVDGVHDVQVSLQKNEAVVQYDEIFTSADKLKQAVEAAGYGVSEVNQTAIETANKGNCCG